MNSIKPLTLDRSRAAVGNHAHVRPAAHLPAEHDAHRDAPGGRVGHHAGDELHHADLQPPVLLGRGNRIHHGHVHGFFEAFDGDDEDLTEFFSRHARYCYIEGRASGANFPDPALAAESDPDVVRSVVISPSALQNGLINNLPEASELLSSYHWPDLAGLRSQTIRHGLAAEYNGIRVKDVCCRVIEIAARGLPGEEHWMFAYPEFVLSKGKNGADRAIESFEKQTGTVAERLHKVILNRRLHMGSLAIARSSRDER